MLQRLFLIASLAIASASLFAGNAEAADCLNCGQPAYDGYVAQPTLAVSHPFVVLRPYYVSDYIPCGNGYAVNQGQYHTKEGKIPQPACH